MFADEHYPETEDDAMRADGAGETHVDAQRGLWIPPQYRDFDTQLVIRTPRTTIQHYSDGTDAYYGMVTEADFGPVEEFQDPKNPELAPRQVSFKPQGEPADTLSVEIPAEVDA
jgi:hypothetical protein